MTEFRTTVTQELRDENSIRAIGEWIHGAPRYALQKFTDRNSVPFEGFHAPEDGTLSAWADLLRPHAKEVLIR